MDYRRFGDVLVVRLDRGEEIIATLAALAKREIITLATVQGIGACDQVKFSLYNVAERTYSPNELHEELELTSLNGNMSMMDGEYYSHLHATFGRFNGAVVGGHLNEARISGTGEIFVHMISGEVERSKDEAETGLNLFDFNKSHAD